MTELESKLVELTNYLVRVRQSHYVEPAAAAAESQATAS
jgi:hypothetical protein